MRARRGASLVQRATDGPWPTLRRNLAQGDAAGHQGGASSGMRSSSDCEIGVRSSTTRGADPRRRSEPIGRRSRSRSTLSPWGTRSRAFRRPPCVSPDGRPGAVGPQRPDRRVERCGVDRFAWRRGGRAPRWRRRRVRRAGHRDRPNGTRAVVSCLVLPRGRRIGPDARNLSQRRRRLDGADAGCRRLAICAVDARVKAEGHQTRPSSANRSARPSRSGGGAVRSATANTRASAPSIATASPA